MVATTAGIIATVHLCDSGNFQTKLFLCEPRKILVTLRSIAITYCAVYIAHLSLNYNSFFNNFTAIRFCHKFK